LSLKKIIKLLIKKIASIFNTVTKECNKFTSCKYLFLNNPNSVDYNLIENKTSKKKSF